MTIEGAPALLAHAEQCSYQPARDVDSEQSKPTRGRDLFSDTGAASIAVTWCSVVGPHLESRRASENGTKRLSHQLADTFADHPGADFRLSEGSSATGRNRADSSTLITHELSLPPLGAVLFIGVSHFEDSALFAFPIRASTQDCRARGARNAGR